MNISFFVAETREKAHRLMARNWRDEDVVNTVADATASSVGTSRHSFTSGVGGWATWNFQDALKYSIYDDPDGCIEQLKNLANDLPGMTQCILEFNRRGRLTNEEIKESMQLFRRRRNAGTGLKRPSFQATPVPISQAAPASNRTYSDACRQLSSLCLPFAYFFPHINSLGVVLLPID